MLIDLDQIALEPDLQCRVETDDETVQKYQTLMEDGVAFDPVRLIQDGETFYIADGNHRVKAARQAGLLSIDAIVVPGSRREAMFEALAANGRHGLSLSNADKHRIVMTILTDPEWSQMTDRDIVRHVGAISQPFVSTRRRCMTLIQQTDPPLTDAEVIAQAGSYSITDTLIGQIRTLLNRPEPLMRKYPPGSFVRFDIGIEHLDNLLIGIVREHVNGIELKVEAWTRSGKHAGTHLIFPEDARPQLDTEYLACWRYANRREPDELLFFRSPHLPYNLSVCFDSIEDFRSFRYSVKVSERWDSALAVRASDQFVEHLRARGDKVRIISTQELDERMRDLLLAAGRARSVSIVYPPHTFKVGDRVLFTNRVNKIQTGVIGSVEDYTLVINTTCGIARASADKVAHYVEASDIDDGDIQTVDGFKDMGWLNRYRSMCAAYTSRRDGPIMLIKVDGRYVALDHFARTLTAFSIGRSITSPVEFVVVDPPHSDWIDGLRRQHASLMGYIEDNAELSDLVTLVSSDPAAKLATVDGRLVVAQPEPAPEPDDPPGAHDDYDVIEPHYTGDGFTEEYLDDAGAADDALAAIVGEDAEGRLSKPILDKLARDGALAAWGRLASWMEGDTQSDRDQVLADIDAMTALLADLRWQATVEQEEIA